MPKPKPGYKLMKWLYRNEIEIPEEWEIKKIIDLTKVSVGLVINPSTYFDENGTVPMITGKHITENGIVLDGVDFITEKSNKLLETTRIWSDDLVTMRVGYPGRTSVVKNEHDGINCASVIITRGSKKFVSQFLGYLANSRLISKQITMHQAGGAQQVVNIGSWKEFLILFPPIQEQQKIASILSSVDDLISSYNNIIDTTKKLKTGLMQTLLTKGIGHKKFKKVKWLFGKEIEIPEEWDYVKLEKYVKIMSGEYFLYSDFADVGVPVLKIDNVMHGKIDWANSTYVPNDFVKSHKEIVLNENDIVLALNRPITHNLVKVARLSKNDVPSLLYQRVGKFEFQNSSVEQNFFFVYLNSPIFKLLLFRILIGSDQPYVKTTELLKQEVGFPTNMKEQQKIATILSNVDSKISDLESKKTSLEKIKKGLMQKLLTGQIRVKV